MKRKLLITILACTCLLAGCGSKEASKEASEDITREEAVQEDKGDSNDKQASLKDWKKYCLADEFIEENLNYNDWLKDLEEGDLDVEEHGRYNIIDMDNNGVPEIMELKKWGNDDCTSIHMFYEQRKHVKVDEPEYSRLYQGYNYVWYVEDSNAFVWSKTGRNISTESSNILISIRKNIYSDNEEACTVENEKVMINSVWENSGTFKVTYEGVDTSDVTGLSASEALALASEFVGQDITTLPENEYPYTLGELVEALKKY